MCSRIIHCDWLTLKYLVVSISFSTQWNPLQWNIKCYGATHRMKANSNRLNAIVHTNKDIGIRLQHKHWCFAIANPHPPYHMCRCSYTVSTSKMIISEFTDKRFRFVRKGKKNKALKKLKIYIDRIYGINVYINALNWTTSRNGDETKIASAKNLNGMPNQFSKERISSRNVDFFYAISSSSFSLPFSFPSKKNIYI